MAVVLDILNKTWKYLAVIVITILVLRGCTKPKEIIVEVPVKVVVEVPVVQHVFDTITEFVPTKETVIDSLYYQKYLALKDSISKEDFIKDALTVREYKETFDDSIQTVEVYTEVTGKMNKQSLSYKTKPREIKVDTTIPVKVKVPARDFSRFAISVGAGFNSQQSGEGVTGKLGLVYKTKKIDYNISRATDGRWWFGTNINL